MKTEPFAIIGMFAFFVLMVLICEFIPMPYSFIAFVCVIVCVGSVGIIGINLCADD